ncbi:MAG: hypothetical protein K1X57_13015 [Gemmataceae bacterium]|nr:hypothetical protein [Gemmataceae bacterium]
MTRNGKSRRGAALIYAMVVLAVIAAMMGHAAREVIAGRRAVERYHRRVQARLLVQSGREILAVRQKADAQYPGEVLEMPAGRITIGKGADGKFTVEGRVPDVTPGDIVVRD